MVITIFILAALILFTESIFHVENVLLKAAICSIAIMCLFKVNYSNITDDKVMDFILTLNPYYVICFNVVVIIFCIRMLIVTYKNFKKFLDEINKDETNF